MGHIHATVKLGGPLERRTRLKCRSMEVQPTRAPPKGLAEDLGLRPEFRARVVS